MIERNSDVNRAIAAVGGEHVPYYSFGASVLRPRTTGSLRPFIYNELGEPEYAPASVATVQMAPAAAPPASRLIDPLYDTLPVVQPPTARSIGPQPVASAPIMQPSPYQATMPPTVVVRTQPRRQVQGGPVQAGPIQPGPIHPGPAQPGPFQVQAAQAAAPAVVVNQHPVAPAPPPAAFVPPPPPFFPLLAAALPNATEPTYTPQYAPAALPEPRGQPANLTPAATLPEASGAAPGASGGHDHRSLAEMFSLLGARGLAAQAPTAGYSPASVRPASAVPAEGQALFRRI